MRHQRLDYKLGRETNHRRQLLRNLVTSLIKAERMMTTVQKARFFRPHAERLITLGKRGGLHARRQAAAFLLDPAAVKKLPWRNCVMSSPFRVTGACMKSASEPSSLALGVSR